MMLRETIDLIATQNGRRFHPTESDISEATLITQNMKIHRERTGLKPISEFQFPNDYTYDIECYPNFFSCSIRHELTFRRWIYEVSNIDGFIVDQSPALYEFLMSLAHFKCRMVGFNNLHYDYPLLHFFIECGGRVTCEMMFTRSRAIFDDKSGRQFNVWDNQRFIPQLDLLKIHHFDNKTKMTSLKMLEFNMRSENIKDLPYDPSIKVTRDQADGLLTYNDHDVDETGAFYIHSLPMIEFRAELSTTYNRDFTNHNDTKIGKDYFLMKLEEAGINTKHVQSPRDSIAIAEVIFPYINFENPEFNRILEFFRSSILDKKDKNGMLELKGYFKGVSAIIDGFQFNFGAGGIHGSLRKTIIRESATHKIIDIDVASYYPNIAIKNDLFPEHLAIFFCQIYLDVYDLRKLYKKGTPENAMLKLALNGVYGDSNNPYSPFLDPKYTLAITVNGQLMLCMLAEQLMKIPDLTMVQINTDGLTFLCPNEYEEHAMNLKTWWEGITKLELERNDYSLMAVRDVNAYLAVTTEGKVKRIGAYAHELALDNASTRELTWNKNQSSVVVAKAAEAALVHGTSIPEFIKKHDDIFDFMLRTKVPRSSSLEMHSDVMWGDQVALQRVTKLQNISRYYASNTGGYLKKIMPPTPLMIEHWNTGTHYQHESTEDYKVTKEGKRPPSGRYKPVPLNEVTLEPSNRVMSVSKGVLVTDCSCMDDFNDDINYEYYIKETRKLVDVLLMEDEI